MHKNRKHTWRQQIDTVNRGATLQETKYYQKKVEKIFSHQKKEPQEIHSSPVIEGKEAKNRDKKYRMVFP